MPPLITIDSLNKTYATDEGNKIAALRDLSLTVDTGEFLTLIGPTGCGKTTLLHCIAGLIDHDRGEVSLAVDASIGCVFQHYRLFPWLSALENIAFGLKMKGMAKEERLACARDLIREVGLEGRENAYPYELSGGMRQRVAIAQALAINPSLLLMDEPLGALDDRTRVELQHLLVRLWQEHRLTILFVTHNIDEAVFLGTRALVFSAQPGRIIKDIPLALPHPRHRLDDTLSRHVMDIRQHLHRGS